LASTAPPLPPFPSPIHLPPSLSPPLSPPPPLPLFVRHCRAERHVQSHVCLPRRATCRCSITYVRLPCRATCRCSITCVAMFMCVERLVAVHPMSVISDFALVTFFFGARSQPDTRSRPWRRHFGSLTRQGETSRRPWQSRASTRPWQGRASSRPWQGRATMRRILNRKPHLCRRRHLRLSRRLRRTSPLPAADFTVA